MLSRCAGRAPALFCEGAMLLVQALVVLAHMLAKGSDRVYVRRVRAFFRVSSLLCCRRYASALGWLPALAVITQVRHSRAVDTRRGVV